MQTASDVTIQELMERWAARFGWLDGTIDLASADLSSFATPDCDLTPHAPLWGTKEGAETARPIADVRKQLARMIRFVRLVREDMHVAIHPGGGSLAIFVRITGRLPLLGIKVRTMPLAFVVEATPTSEGLRIKHVHEWAATDPLAARDLLVRHHGWPADTEMKPQVAFGAAS